MKPGKVSSSFHPVSSRPFSKHLSVPEHWNIASHWSIPFQQAVPTCFQWGSSLGSELATSELSNSSPGKKFLSVLMCVAGNCHAEKWLHHLQICHTAERDTDQVFQHILVSSASPPRRRVQMNHERKWHIITEPPPKFLLKNVFWHRANNICNHLDHPNSISFHLKK